VKSKKTIFKRRSFYLLTWQRLTFPERPRVSEFIVSVAIALAAKPSTGRFRLRSKWGGAYKYPSLVIVFSNGFSPFYSCIFFSAIRCTFILP
jgi:hypothetical protein